MAIIQTKQVSGSHIYFTGIIYRSIYPYKYLMKLIVWPNPQGSVIQ